jgi:hypothetical protein
MCESSQDQAAASSPAFLQNQVLLALNTSQIYLENTTNCTVYTIARSRELFCIVDNPAVFQL